MYLHLLIKYIKQSNLIIYTMNTNINVYKILK